MQSVLWDPNVVHANVLRVQFGKDFHDQELPPVCRHLELFVLPEGHMAHPGLGVKTTEFIGKGAELVHYAGHCFPLDFFPHGGSYSFETWDGQIVDAAKLGNISRYINDPKGSKFLKANVAYDRSKKFEHHKRKFETRRIVAIRDIQPGEEILMKYGANRAYWEQVASSTGSVPVVHVVHPAAVAPPISNDLFIMKYDREGKLVVIETIKAGAPVQMRCLNGTPTFLDTLKEKMIDCMEEPTAMDQEVTSGKESIVTMSSESGPVAKEHEIRFSLMHTQIKEPIQFTCIYNFETGKQIIKAVVGGLKFGGKHLGRVYDKVCVKFANGSKKTRNSARRLFEKSGLKESDFNMFISNSRGEKRVVRSEAKKFKEPTEQRKRTKFMNKDMVSY